MKFKSVLLAFSFVLLSGICLAQNKVTLFGSTGYTTPADEIMGRKERNLFDSERGLVNWGGENRQPVYYYFNVKQKGRLEVNALMQNTSAVLRLSIDGQSKTIKLKNQNAFETTELGSFKINKPGFYAIQLESMGDANTNIEIKSFELSGTAAEGIHANPKPRRNAASVHLSYPLTDTIKAVSFYNEVTIPKGADHLYSYYMACGFSRGYFGIQVNSKKERRVIFSVWDAGNEAVDRNKVNDDNRVKLLAKGDEVVADDFGNEGTGGHSHWVYNWKTDNTYKFYVNTVTDPITKTTTYSGYFFVPELQQWKLIASFKAPKDEKGLRGLYSFVENFDGVNGHLMRKAYFGNQWIQRENGKWMALTKSSFSYDATGKAGDRIDYGAGTENNKFYLWNGGFKNADAKFGDVFTHEASTRNSAN